LSKEVIMFCSKCGAPNEDGSVYCGNCGAALEADVEQAAEPIVPGEVPAEMPAVPSVEGEPQAPAPAVEVRPEIAVAKREPAVEGPVPSYLAPAAPAVHKVDPNTAFLIEFLAGFFGLLGIGYMYAGRTSDGIVRLVVWLVYIAIAVVILLTIIGFICLPVLLAIQVVVPLLSANALKKQLLAQG